MVKIDIEYCVPCGFLGTAIETQHDLLTAFGRDLDGVRLVPGHGGVFRVSVDDETVWDRDVHGDSVDTDVLVEAVENRLEGT
jgi:selenoprotein W-related protein